MRNNSLRRAVRFKLKGITDRALNYRIANEMAANPTATREDALLLVAAKAGINISRYDDDPSRLDRIRQLLRDGEAAPTPSSPPPGGRRPRTPRSVKVTIAGNLDLTDPILPERIIREAKMMAEQVYPKLYILENSVREIVLRVMQAAHGQSWWSTHAPAKVRREVSKRKADEKRKPWHGTRGAHEIYYSDIAHLRQIVNANVRDFGELFPDLGWFNYTINVVTPSRNVCAHHNPLRNDDVARIDINLRDWQKHIEAHRHLIPDLEPQP